MSRHLRIAAAVVFALLALAFVALWVRSYVWCDFAYGVSHNARYFEFASHGGGVVTTICHRNILWDGKPEWGVDTFPFAAKRSVHPIEERQFGFDYVSDEMSKTVIVPHWFLALSSLGLAALFAFKRNWRFTVRSLLIATTVIAATLGLVVYAV